ncbi:interferon-induced helicase C domain-containing protein 1 [Platysternon megacephalum]|uniref:Interferon-induced helicase C domain-containing protein 1 n=1 Tax=Platysternon megacephalum TaxID=55544 RepID=A0A4D9EZE5_9SAUR|nr:interferon-induced helicase C domain-containing protein 1 [Platysternon megacephalum]
MSSPGWVACAVLQKKLEINMAGVELWDAAAGGKSSWTSLTWGSACLEGLHPIVLPSISPQLCKLMNKDLAKQPRWNMIFPILEEMQEK